MVESIPTLALFRGTALLLGGEAAAALPPPLRSVYFLPEPEPVGSGTSSLFLPPLELLLAADAADAAAFEVLLLDALEVSARVELRLCEVLGPAVSCAASELRDRLRLLDSLAFCFLDLEVEEVSAEAADALGLEPFVATERLERGAAFL